ncbi:MAG: CvpA family protein [Succinivibrionaceae bacterium]|nr:CvpA family protein [Succinivibrionaceae bacterium]
MELILTDWVIIAIVVISTLFSIMNGFVKECLSIINWFMAFAIAKFFYYDLSQSALMASMQADFRIPVSILVLFVTSLILGAVAVYFVVRILRKTDGTLSVTDRILGMCFGALRGVMMICAALAVCNILFNLGLFSFIQKMPFWENSAFIPEFNKVVFWFFDKINVTGVINDVVNSALDPQQSGVSSSGLSLPLSDQAGAAGHALDPALGGQGVDPSAFSVTPDGKVVVDPAKLGINPQDVDRIVQESK